MTELEVLQVIASRLGQILDILEWAKQGLFIVVIASVISAACLFLITALQTGGK